MKAIGLCWQGVLAALVAALVAATMARAQAGEDASPKDVLAGLRAFWDKTALPDGSFRPGVDPKYKGMSDCAFSDLAAVTYACTLHRTFGWKLRYEQKTIAFLQSRQHEDGAFFNVGGTADPRSPLARLYNTTQGLVALNALGAKPRYSPLPVFDAILNMDDYKDFPGYATSFFPLAYRVYGKTFPPEADRKIRALMIQGDDGYLHNHIASTYHLVHYYRLVGAATPKADAMLARVLREQKPDGSWMLNPLARDRHGCFDAVFVLRQLGHKRADCNMAMQKAARWVLTCRNPDGGFGHYPGSTSDADAIYFHVGVLVMSGYLAPVDPLPPNPQLLSWGHLFPLPC